MFRVTHYIEQSYDVGDDALSVFEKDGAIWFCVADGAGGTGLGRLASDYIVADFNGSIDTKKSYDQYEFETYLKRLDLEISRKNSGAESTAIMGCIRAGIVVGASVGDCEAWIFNNDYDYALTQMQYLKPLLGSGEAQPIGFGPMLIEQSLLMGSDGLFKYASFKAIREHVFAGVSAEGIAALAKGEAGGLQDDIAVVLISNSASAEMA